MRRSLAQSRDSSYFIEGLLYNVPNEKFTGTYAEMVFNVLKWLCDTPDRSKFLTVNERYKLIYDNSAVCWPSANAKLFIDAVIKCWNDWS